MKSQVATQGMVVRRTNGRKGRSISVTPKSTVMKHLSYGRIILDGDLSTVSFDTGSSETALICLAGMGQIHVAGQVHELGRYDSIYVPRDSAVKVSTRASVDFAECSAPVERSYPVQVVKYADVEKDGSLKFSTGGPSAERTVNILVGKNVQAGRLLAGVTTSAPGNWTSWPPHEHASMLEELYVYYDMPSPAFGVQFVYTNPEDPELVTLVRDGDAVLMPRGYHPNVSVPGHPINFLWIMAAHREVEDRQFGVVTVQPGFDKAGSGLEASRE